MENRVRIIGKIGLTEIIYITISLTLISSIGIFHVMGIGKPPNVKIEAYVDNHDIKIRVLEGNIPRSDWQYIYFDIKTNPPIIWFKAPRDLKPGVEITLAKNLPSGTYKIQIIHKPTMKIIFEDKVVIP